MPPMDGRRPRRRWSLFHSFSRFCWMLGLILVGVMFPFRFLFFTFDEYDDSTIDSSRTFVAQDQQEEDASSYFTRPTDTAISDSTTTSSSTGTRTTKIVLYITTHFSDIHIRYFHCCWPKLVAESPLIRQSHVIVAATNATPVPLEELQYLQNTLFASNPSYQFWTPTKNASHISHCEPFKTPNNPKKNKVSVSYKQCLANYGVAFGWSRLMDQQYDWMIRLNPDVLIRQSQWFLQVMQYNNNTSSLDAILVNCGPNTRQIHTDFWAIRPNVLLLHNNNKNKNNNNNNSSNDNKSSSSYKPFERMGRIGIHLNHERTAFQQFRPILASKRYAWVPHVEPSQGICRVRGPHAWVYHEHDSCTPTTTTTTGSTSGAGDEYNNNMVCHGLEGWDLSK